MVKSEKRSEQLGLGVNNTTKYTAKCFPGPSQPQVGYLVTKIGMRVGAGVLQALCVGDRVSAGNWLVKGDDAC